MAEAAARRSGAMGGDRAEGDGDRGSWRRWMGHRGRERGDWQEARVKMGMTGLWAKRTAGKQVGLAARLSLTLKINK